MAKSTTVVAKKDPTPTPSDADALVGQEDPDAGSAALKVVDDPEPIFDEDDADRIELAEAQKAIKDEPGPDDDDDGNDDIDDGEAEEGKPSEEPAEDGAAADAVAVVEPAKTPAVTPEGAMIPKARLDEVLGQRDQAINENAYLQGQLKAIQSGVVSQKPEEVVPEVPLKDQLVSKRVELQTLAAKVDSGEMSAADLELARVPIEDQIFDIQMEMRAPAKDQTQAPAEQTPAATSDLYLADRTAELEAAHPFTHLIDDQTKIGAARWDAIRNEAQINLGLAEDTDFNDPVTLIALRGEMAKLTDVYGPLWTGLTMDQAVERLEAQAQQPQTVTTPKTPAPSQGASGLAKGRKAKIDEAANHPPNVSALGRADEGAGIVTDAQIADMSDEEIAALPQSARRKINPD